MSKEARKQQRLEKKSTRKRMLILAVFFIAILVLIGLIRDKQAILKKSLWKKETNATFYFFKAVNDAEVDDFNTKTITVEPGAKTNGYSVLASQALTVNVGWAERQKKILQDLIDKNAAEDWASIIDKTIQKNEDTMVVDLEEVALSEIAPYIGLTTERLNEKLAVMTEFTKGSPVEVSLDNLDLIRSGAVYTGTTNRRRVLNENFLPYLNTALLKAIDRTDKTLSSALTVVGNDHIYAVTVLNAKTEISGEDLVSSLKTENIEATGVAERDYYSMLTNRDDLVRRYPTLDMTINGKTTEVYLVDCKREEQKKLLVLMIKDSTALFLREEKTEGTLEIQRILGYIVPRSAVKKNGAGKDVLTLMERTYFPEEVEVNVTKKDGTNYVLRAADNPELSEGGLYKVYP